MAQKAVRIKWYGKKLEQNLHDEMVKRLQLVGEELRGRILENISKPTDTLGPSRPGEFPHADSGDLRKYMFWDIDAKRLVVIVATPLNYGLFLELGTSKMAARPYLRRTMNDNLSMIRRVLTAKLGGSVKFVSR